MPSATPPRLPRGTAEPSRRFDRAARALFLERLGETSNVAASALHAGVSTAKVYAARRRDPAFYAEWRAALAQGYELLEFDLVRRLRDGEFKTPARGNSRVRVFDNAVALRVLLAHRETVSEERARRDDEDEATVAAELDARLEALRSALLARRAEREPQG